MVQCGQRIIGGKFGLARDLATAESSRLALKDQLLCALNGRSCIRVLVEQLGPSTVWMPSYLCPTMLQPLRQLGIEPSFYDVDDRLSVRDHAWLDLVGPRELVVFIDYFGFPCPRELLHEAAQRGAWVLEDACQALLTEGVGQDAHFVLYSPRKFFGVPDGGILAYDAGIDLGDVCLDEPPAGWWLRAFEAIVLRREFDSCGGDRRWFEMLADAAKTIPVGYYAMSEFSQIICFHGTDFEAMAKARVANYSTLLGLLSGLALFPELPSGVVPLGFPIRVENRDDVRQRLFKDEIYPPVHWLLEDAVPERFRESHRLSCRILTLPCDQRYGPADMKRMGEAVLDAVHP